jgi:hypothetical protein
MAVQVAEFQFQVEQEVPGIESLIQVSPIKLVIEKVWLWPV